MRSASTPVELRHAAGRHGTLELRIGCSGWNYKSWKGRFYPVALPPARWLQHYASVFDTVEINNTFYRLPEGSTFASWRAQMPEGFLATVKASRYLTHMKRLRDPAEPVQRLFARAAELGPRLGPVLYQLPANFHADIGRLRDFLAVLPRTHPQTGRPMTHVMEFRHRSWYTDEVFRLLEGFGVALCLHDKAGSEVMEPSVGPAIYVRFHGTSGRYHGSYGDSTLRLWARRLAGAWRAGQDVYAYFNNDPDAIATQNAQTLRHHLEALTG
jgi:uncharacterized protein YecE (DUF72 family)